MAAAERLELAKAMCNHSRQIGLHFRNISPALRLRFTDWARWIDSERAVSIRA